jgi:putative two-component system response regulator
LGANTLIAVFQRYPNNTFIQMGIEIAQSHHERWDGLGYPEGLVGENIPLSARIMAVADVYDALRSKRSYKDSMDHAAAVAVIKQGEGSHFDPVIVKVFSRLNEEIARIHNVRK